MAEKIGLEAVLDDSQFQAGVKAYNTGIDQMEGANRGAAASMEQIGATIDNLGARLSNSGPAKLASEAIDRLASRAEAGDISLDELGESVGAIQQQFGIVTPAGQAAAAEFEKLSRQFDSGEISAKEYAQQLGSLGTKMDGTNESALEMAAKMEIVQQSLDAVRDIASEGLELAELGARAERVEQRFAAFAEEAGGAEVVLGAFQRGAGGTVPKMDAMATSARLLQMGIVDSGDSMAEFVEMATRLGDQTLSAEQRVSDLSLTIANQSIPRLDNFGISSGAVRARIEELQAATEGLSREEAFRQAVFEQGEISLDKLGARVEDNAMAFEKAQAKMADARVEMGQKLAPIFATVASVVASLSSEVLIFAGALGTAIPLILKFGGGISGVSAKLANVPMAAGLAAVAIAGLALAYAEYNNQLDEINAKQAEAEGAIASLSQQTLEQAEAEGSLSAAMVDLGGRIVEVDEATSNLSTKQQIALGIFGKTDDVARQVSDALFEAKRAAFEGSETYGEYDAAIRAFNAAVGDSDLQIKAMTLSEFENAKATAEAGGAMVQFVHNVGELAHEYDGLVLSAENTADETRFLTREIEDADEAIEDTTGSTEDLTYKAETLAEKEERLQGASERLAHSQEMQAKQTEYAKDEAKKAADAADRLAQETEDARQAAADAAIAYSDLAMALMDATAADVAKEALGRLKQAAEDGIISDQDYKEASRELMLQFGLTDEQALAYVDGLDILEGALYDGRLASDDFTEATGNLVEAGEDGVVSTEEVLGVYERFPATFGEAEGAMGRAETKMGEDLPASAREADEALGELEAGARDAGGALAQLESDAATSGSAVGSNFAGGIVQSIPIVVGAMADMAKAAREQLPSSEPKDTSSPFYDLASSGAAVVENIAGGILDAAPHLISVIKDIGDDVGKIGDDWGGKIKQKLYDSLVGGFIDPGRLPFDQFFPDTFEGLLDIGRAIGGLGGTAAKMYEREMIEPLEERAKGMEDAIDDTRKSLDKLKGQREKLAGIIEDERISEKERLELLKEAGKIEEALNESKERAAGQAAELVELERQRGEILEQLENKELGEIKRKALKTRADELNDEIDLMEELADKESKLIGDLQKQREKLLKTAEKDRLTNEERTELLQEAANLNVKIAALEEEIGRRAEARAEVVKEMQERQAKVDALQTEQEQMGFLQEQMDLITLISERGLNAGKILQDLQLGADADPEEIMEAMTRALRDVNRQLAEQIENRDELIARLEEERELAEAQAELEAAKARQKFLQDQIGLLDMIEEHGLDAEDILQGFEIGADASLLDFTNAMQRAIEAMIKQTEDELGIESPSKVFERMGGLSGEGYALGLTESLAGAAQAFDLFTTQAMSAPAFSPATSTSSVVDNSRSIGDINFNGPLGSDVDVQRAGVRIRREVEKGIRGVQV